MAVPLSRSSLPSSLRVRTWEFAKTLPESIRAAASLPLLPRVPMAIGILDRSEFAHPGLELPGDDRGLGPSLGP